MIFPCDWAPLSQLHFQEVDDDDDITIVVGCRNGQLSVIRYVAADSSVSLLSTRKLQTRIVGRDVMLTCLARLPQTDELVTSLGNGQLSVWSFDDASGSLRLSPAYQLEKCLVPVKRAGELSNYLEVSSLCFHPLSGLLCPRFRRTVPRSLSQPFRVQITESMGVFSVGVCCSLELAFVCVRCLRIRVLLSENSFPPKGGLFFSLSVACMCRLLLSLSLSVSVSLSLACVSCFCLSVSLSLMYDFAVVTMLWLWNIPRLRTLAC
jgi:hypothetical protein